jgi:hypothetical protein
MVYSAWSYWILGLLPSSGVTGFLDFSHCPVFSSSVCATHGPNSTWGQQNSAAKCHFTLCQVQFCVSNMDLINKYHVEYLSLTALDGLTDEMKRYAEHITQPF